MHSMKVILVLSLILAAAFAEGFVEETRLEGDDLKAAKALLAKALDKLPGTKYEVVNWLSTEFRTLHTYVVDVNNGSGQNECTFKIWQSLPVKENDTEVNMSCQGGGSQVSHTW